VLKTVVAPMGMSTDISPDQQALGEAFVNSLVGTSVFDTFARQWCASSASQDTRDHHQHSTDGRHPERGRGQNDFRNVPHGLNPRPPQELGRRRCVARIARLQSIGRAAIVRDRAEKAVIRATDAALLSQLVAATMPTASVGAIFASVLVDLAALLAAVDIQPTSRVYLVITTARAKVWALMLTAAGGLFAFPGLTVTGGTIAGGIEVIASESLPTNRSLMVVADGLIGNSLPFELRQIRQGDIQLTTPPDSPSTAATVLRGMWQNNIQALTIERYWAMEPVRAKSLASLSH
jgi:hypothetical protein